MLGCVEGEAVKRSDLEVSIAGGVEADMVGSGVVLKYAGPNGRTSSLCRGLYPR